MAEPELNRGREGRTAGRRTDMGTPRWVKVLGAVLAVLILGVALMLIFGPGDHGPGRHAASGTAAAGNVAPVDTRA